MSRRAVRLLVPVLVLLGACSGDDDASSSTFAPPLTNPPLPTNPITTTTIGSTTTSTTAIAPTTTVGSTTPTSDVGSATTISTTPPTTSTGDPDWQAIVQQLSDTLAALEADPSADDVDTFCLEGANDCQSVQGEAVRQFAEEGWRTVDVPPVEIISAELTGTADGLPIEDAPFVVVVAVDGPADFTNARVIDRSGSVVFEIEAPDDDTQTQWLLARNLNGDWRVTSVRSLDR